MRGKGKALISGLCSVMRLGDILMLRYFTLHSRLNAFLAHKV
jgi:hypothetical protein